MKISVPFLFVFLFGCSTLSFAQRSRGDDEANFHNGIKAGWHYANMYRSGSAPYDNLNSFYIGFFSERKIAPLMRVGSSLEYFQNGFQNSDATFRMHTISLPFYLKLKVGPIFGTAGFAANFKLSDNREDFPGGTQTTAKVVDTKLFDLPLALGLGVKFLFIQVEAKYNWGLFDAATINGFGHKNQYFQLGMSFIF